jgi:hypothetical protein
MLHRCQQLRIDPRQPGQRPGVEAIILPSTLPDQAHVARMRHDHFVPQLAQHTAHPRRMHSGLQRDTTARRLPNWFLHLPIKDMEEFSGANDVLSDSLPDW